MNTNSCKKSGWAVLAMALVCWLAVGNLGGDLWAAEYTWDGSSNQNWDNASRWSDSGEPWTDAGHVGIVNSGRPQTTTTAFQGELRINAGGSLRINSVTTTYTANNLVLNGGALWKTDQTPTPTLAGNISVTADSEIQAPAGTVGPTTISATLSGSGNLERVKTSTGVDGGLFNFTANNSGYSGNWTVSGGHLSFGQANAAGMGTITVNGGGVGMSPGHTYANTIRINSGGLLHQGLTGGGTVTLSDLRLNGGQIYRVSSTAITLAGNMQVEADSEIGLSGNPYSISAIISGASGLKKLSGNTLNVSGDNVNFAGSWEILGQEVRFGHANAMGKGAIVIAAGTAAARLNLQQNWTLANDVEGIGKLLVGQDGSSGAADRTLTYSGGTLTPGLDGGAGILTIENGREPTTRRANVDFAKHGTTNAMLVIAVTGGGAVAGTDYSQLRITRGNISGLANADLVVKIDPALTQTDLAEATLTVLLTSDGSLTDATPAFNSVTFDPPNWSASVAYHASSVTLSDFVIAGAPFMTNVGAYAVTETSADMVGHLSGGALPATVTCFWGTEDGDTDPALWPTNDTWTATALGLQTNVVAEGLVSGQRYHFRFYATNAVMDSWTPGKVTFSTLGAPKVVNLAPTGVGQTNATLRGDLQGGNPEPEVWIYWGTEDGVEEKTAWNRPVLSLGATGLTAFEESASGLLANQTYWYRCYASNAYDGGRAAWAPVSTNFTTALPTLTIANASVIEGPEGATTSAVFAVTLSAASGQSVSVDFATADGTATLADNDYEAASGTLVIPAGIVSTQIVVTVIGDDVYEANETFTVNLSNFSGATLGNTQATGTILNDDWDLYVRGDGAGSDANNGATWATAFETLQKALNTAPAAPAGRGNIPASTPTRIRVQASGAEQAYDVAARTVGAALDLDFQGGWEHVDTTPVQTGLSRVEDLDGTVNEAGISILNAPSWHYNWRRVVVNRFVFTNVTRAVSIDTAVVSDSADIYLIVSNTVAHTTGNGLHVEYPKTHASTSFGGKANITAMNVDIAAGLGGSGHGLYIRGSWMGSRVSAEGLDPDTGYPRVSSIRSDGGSGVFFSALNNETHDALFEHTVIHDCTGDGIYLDAMRVDAGPVTNWYRVQATLNHCTIADNDGDGLRMVSRTSSSWAAVTNSIFAGNGGYGINLGEAGYSVFTCPEEYNVFYDDTLLVNNSAQAPSSAGDPLFYADKTKPHPWYTLGTKASPAYDSATPEGHRGAYQEVTVAQGTLMILR